MAADGRSLEMGGGRKGMGAKRFAATELTCSHLLNSSAMASSLSNWGRWISAALHETSLTGISVLRPSPIPFLDFTIPRGCFYL